MSWDVWILNEKSEIASDLLDESQLNGFGEFTLVKRKINSVVPGIDWADDTYPHVSNGAYLGHIGLGKTDQGECDSIMFHVYGGDNPIKSIVDVCKNHDWLAFDTTTEKYLDLDNPDETGWIEFQSFRKAVHQKLGGESPVTISFSKKKWWQFWK